MLQPGGIISFGSIDKSSHGVLTCFVYKPSERGVLYGLTCAHCGIDVGNDTLFDGLIPGKPAAFLSKTMWTKGTESGGSSDMAIFKVMGARSFTEDNFKVAHTSVALVASQRRYLVNNQLSATASAITTGLTRIQFFGPWSHSTGSGRGVQEPSVEAMTDPNRFKITGISCRKGDSGAPVYLLGGAIIGMFHMGDGTGSEPGTTGMVIHIDHVFRTLDVTLATWANRNEWLPPEIKEEESDEDDEPAWVIPKDPFGDSKGGGKGGSFSGFNPAYKPPSGKSK